MIRIEELREKNLVGEQSCNALSERFGLPNDHR